MKTSNVSHVILFWLLFQQKSQPMRVYHSRWSGTLKLKITTIIFPVNYAIITSCDEVWRKVLNRPQNLKSKYRVTLLENRSFSKIKHLIIPRKSWRAFAPSHSFRFFFFSNCKGFVSTYQESNPVKSFVTFLLILMPNIFVETLWRRGKNLIVFYVLFPVGTTILILKRQSYATKSN